MPKKLNGTVIVTYRCNARCNMCNRYQAPSRPEEEITLDWRLTDDRLWCASRDRFAAEITF